MNRRLKILLFGLCGVIAVGAVCFFCLRENEPSYNGRTLSEYLRIMPDSYDEIGVGYPSRDEEVAVQSIGTNAIPCLLSWSRSKGSKGRRVIESTVESLPQKFRPNWLTRAIHESSPVYKFELAQTGFRVLGTNALAALPELERRFAATTNQLEANLLVSLMRVLGTNALDFFMNGVHPSHDRLHRRESVYGIVATSIYLRTNKEPAIQILLQIAQNPNDPVQDRAINGLTELNVPARIAIPVLTNAINSTNWVNRISVLEALKHFGTNACAAVPTIKRALQDPSPLVRERAAFALERIAPETQTNRN